MANMLANAVAWLDGQRSAHLSDTVAYQRGGASVEVAATLGATTYEVADESGMMVETKGTDFIVSASELVLSGVTVMPEIGDTIKLIRNGKLLTFEVLDLVGGGHYRNADPHGHMLRIHAKQTSESPA